MNELIFNGDVDSEASSAHTLETMDFSVKQIDSNEGEQSGKSVSDRKC